MMRLARPWCLLAGMAALFAYAFYFSLPDGALPSALAGAGTGKTVRIFFGTTLWLTLFFAVVSQLHFALRAVALSLSFLPGAFFAYVGAVYGQPYDDSSFILDVMQTHAAEALPFFGATEIALLAGFFALMCASAYALGKCRPRLRRKKTMIAAMIVVLFLMKNSHCAFPIRQISAPIKYVRRFGTAGLDAADTAALEALARVESLPQNSSRDPRRKENAPIVFLHIGESVRADHVPFNGYARDTMPRMRREFESGALVSFPKCVSFSNRTRYSLLGIMTPAAVLDPVIRGGTFVPALRENGIRAEVFASSISPDFLNDRHDVPLAVICRNFDGKTTRWGTSDTLFSAVSSTLSCAGNQSFFLYYGEGSHVPFRRYNRRRYGVFAPHGNGRGDAAAANYDNGIVATDDFCGNAVDALRGKNAVYIYVADHGQMLGENGSFDRPYRRKEVRHVLFFIWCSESFRRENPEKWRALVENRERLGVVSHDFVYHSVLGLYGIRTPFYEEKFDLFSPLAQPFPTEMPEAEAMSELRFEGETLDWGK